MNLARNFSDIINNITKQKTRKVRFDSNYLFFMSHMYLNSTLTLTHDTSLYNK